MFEERGIRSASLPPSSGSFVILTKRRPFSLYFLGKGPMPPILPLFLANLCLIVVSDRRWAGVRLRTTRPKTKEDPLPLPDGRHGGETWEEGEGLKTTSSRVK